MKFSIDRDKLYKIVALSLFGLLVFLFCLVIILFIRVRKNEKILSSLELSLANPALTLDSSDDGSAEVSGYGKNIDLADDEADLIIDGNENVSYAIDDDEQSDEGRFVYLTFDDGPSSNTLQILKILKEYDVKATFFVNGKQSEELRDLITQISEQGHTVGMHSYSHKYAQIYNSPDSFKDDLDSIEHLIYAQTGKHPVFYRFPGGSSNSVSRGRIGNFISILKASDIEYVDWNISSGDATGTTSLSPSVITANVIDGYKESDCRTNVVLMHDTDLRDSTVEALPDIIKELRNEGATLDKIDTNTPVVHHVEE